MNSLLRSIPFLLLLAVPVAGAQDFEAQRRQLVEEIRGDVEGTRVYIGKDALDPRVMEVMAKVERHEFVPPERRAQAYLNRPLPIGYGQTISQPYIVALMTDLMRPRPDHVVLEIGTGSGYQAAVLAELVKEVYTIEIIPELAASATALLERLGYDTVKTKVGDGYYGWEEHGPYDGIIVTAAASHIPPPLIEQLKPGGVMIIPVGGAFLTQYLVLVEKEPDGTVTTRELLPVRFVPFTGGRG